MRVTRPIKIHQDENPAKADSIARRAAAIRRTFQDITNTQEIPLEKNSNNKKQKVLTDVKAEKIVHIQAKEELFEADTSPSLTSVESDGDFDDLPYIRDPQAIVDYIGVMLKSVCPSTTLIQDQIDLVQFKDLKSTKPNGLLDDVVDIDASSVNDCDAVAEYANEIYQNLRASELKYPISPDLFARQQHITPKTRSVLIDWMVRAHSRLKLHTETLFLAVNYMDRYLCEEAVSVKELQHVGITSLLIASKYEEVYPPDLSDLHLMSDIPEEIIKKCEASILITLNFRLTVPTTHVFVSRFLRAANASLKTKQFAFYFSQRLLEDFQFACVPPSKLAASCVYLALHTIGRVEWTNTLEWYTKYSMDDIIATVERARTFIITPTKMTAVKEKFKKPKYGRVSCVSIPAL